MSDQLALIEPDPIPEHRVKILASQLAAFTWPSYGTFDRLPRPAQLAAMVAAQEALEKMRDVELPL